MSLHLFNPTLHQHRLARARQHAVQHQTLLEIAAERALERLSDIQRSFSHGVDVGSYHFPHAAKFQALSQVHAWTGAGGDAAYPDHLPFSGEALPVLTQTPDLMVSLLTFHLINDLPGLLLQARQMLAEDGCFLAIIPGGATLHELRQSLMAAELSLSHGVHPRVMPMVDVRSAGSLLQRAGFALPVVDSETITFTYSDIFALMKDLRGMAATNLLVDQPKTMASRRMFLAAAEHYHQHYALPDGRIPASFELVTLMGWKPHQSQPQPATRGSGSVSLAKALK